VKARNSSALLILVIAVMCACGQKTPELAQTCPPNLDEVAPLEVLAKESGDIGEVARSTISYLVREQVSPKGYFLSRKPFEENGAKVGYKLLHDSGFSMPCGIAGAPNGRDGTLEWDSKNKSVIRLNPWD
jgi:hypothetical protein